MFQKEIAQMMARARAGVLQAQKDDFSLQDVDRDLEAISSDFQSDYLFTFCKQVTRAYLELNGITPYDSEKKSWK